ncbi:endoplasmic reticulum junction formation protein lunapark-B-like [Haliotis asinina]|uniref:endoplasmic reticulum junction formation protein lunapark-B-like n=1 Tax=Haliotis asinina TaxID=109174 RepID=UPI003531B68E
MGMIIGKFRKKKTTVEILEGIDKDITKLQRFRRHNQELQKKFIASLILYSIVLYIICAIVFYFWYFPDTWKERFIYSLPLLAFPFIIWGIKKTLHWYFVKRIASNDISLGELREKKKQILEDVMEKETYKKAKEILEKFDPARFKQLEKPAQPTPRVVTPSQGSALRQRVAPRMATPMRPGVRTPMTTPHLPQSATMSGQRMRMSANGQFMTGYGSPPGPPLPRPILPRERGNFDKVVEYLVGDGPQNRYALICRYCHSHNGMALKEEFEFLSFRCCYCYAMNPARKQRPHAPKLEFPAPPSPAKRAATQGEQKVAEDDDEDSEYDEEDDSEESGSSADKNKESSQLKTENIEIKKPTVGTASASTAPASTASSKEAAEILEKNLKFADEDNADGKPREITQEKQADEDHKQEVTVKAETRTE